MRFAWILLLLATPAAAAPSAGKLVTLDVDLDGDGKPEQITLDKDGTLMAGLGESSVEYDELDGPAHTTVEVISLGGKRRGIYLVTDRQEGEDPPSRHQIFFYQPGSLKRVFNEIVDAKKITFSKQGTGRYVESSWGACMRDQDKKKKSVMRAKKQIVTIRLDAKATKMIETRKTGTEVVKCDELSACPFVYEVVNGEARFFGEILRNVRHEPALQSLAIGKGAGKTTVRLAEEKPELTFVDEIYLDVDGKKVHPAECAVQSMPYCEADGRSTLLMQGDVLELVFDAPAGNRHLWARGYYNPIID